MCSKNKLSVQLKEAMVMFPHQTEDTNSADFLKITKSNRTSKFKTHKWSENFLEGFSGWLAQAAGEQENLMAEPGASGSRRVGTVEKQEGFQSAVRCYQGYQHTRIEIP